MKNIQLKFELLCTQISECIASEWETDDVVRLDEEEVQEITADDEKPFYVDVVALYEGLSNNNRIYGKDAVKSCVDAMVGVNMYKGHVEPGTQGWKYREPVGKIVAARCVEIEVEGKKVLAAKGKAYITESEKKLRSDIKKKMAGHVSILGNARMVRKYGEVNQTVMQIHKPLKSIDFCNPGTGGLTHAGVTGIVSEMDAVEAQQDTQPKKEDNHMKLTKEELLAEYAPEITALVGEQVESQIQEVASGRRDLAEQREAFKDEKAALHAEIAEMKQKLTASQNETAQWKERYENANAENIKAQLAVYANEAVAEMKELVGTESKSKIVDLAAKRVNQLVVDGDLEKSKNAYKNALKSAFEDMQELSEMFGGSAPHTPSGPTKRHAKNTSGEVISADKKILSILSPDLVKARQDRFA